MVKAATGQSSRSKRSQMKATAGQSGHRARVEPRPILPSPPLSLLVSDVPRERASPWDKGLEPPAVTPDRIRNDKEARVSATERPDGVMVEEVKDCVARWPQQEDMKRARGAQGQKVQALSRSRCGVAGYAWLRRGWMVGREDFWRQLVKAPAVPLLKVVKAARRDPCPRTLHQGWQGRGGARGAGRQKAAPPAGARGAAKFRGR